MSRLKGARRSETGVVGSSVDQKPTIDMSKSKTCWECGASLPAATPAARAFCNDECRAAFCCPTKRAYSRAEPVPVSEARPCLHCSVTMTGRLRKFCDAKCRDTYKNDRKQNKGTRGGPCAHCGKPIEGRIRKYCDDECRYRHSYAGVDRTRTCKQCGKTEQAEGRGRVGEFCSLACRDYFKRRGKHWRFCKCAECGSEFHYRIKGVTLKFCGDSCAKRWHNREQDRRNGTKLTRRQLNEKLQQCRRERDDAREQAKGPVLAAEFVKKLQEIEQGYKAKLRDMEARHWQDFRKQKERYEQQLAEAQARAQWAGVPTARFVEGAPWEQHVVRHEGHAYKVRVGKLGLPCVYTIEFPDGTMYVGRSMRITKRMDRHWHEDHPEWRSYDVWTIRLVYVASLDEAAALEEALAKATWDRNHNKSHNYGTYNSYTVLDPSREYQVS